MSFVVYSRLYLLKIIASCKEWPGYGLPLFPTPDPFHLPLTRSRRSWAAHEGCAPLMNYNNEEGDILRWSHGGCWVARRGEEERRRVPAHQFEVWNVLPKDCSVWRWHLRPPMKQKNEGSYIPKLCLSPAPALTFQLGKMKGNQKTPDLDEVNILR